MTCKINENKYSSNLITVAVVVVLMMVMIAVMVVTPVVVAVGNDGSLVFCFISLISLF